MRPDDGAADLVLRPGQRPDHVDRERLVRSDAPEQDLSLAGLRVERPAAVLRDDRNRERPVLGPDIEDAPAGLLRQPVHLAVLGEEPPPIEIVLRGVAGGEDPLIASEDLRERCFVLRLDGSEERLHRRVHGGEGAQADVVRVGRHPYAVASTSASVNRFIDVLRLRGIRHHGNRRLRIRRRGTHGRRCSIARAPSWRRCSLHGRIRLPFGCRDRGKRCRERAVGLAPLATAGKCRLCHSLRERISDTCCLIRQTGLLDFYSSESMSVRHERRGLCARRPKIRAGLLTAQWRRRARAPAEPARAESSPPGAAATWS